MPAKTWSPTLCFRRFRIKHTELSKIYWTHNLGAESLLNSFKGVSSDSYATNVIRTTFPVGMFPYTVADTTSWIGTYLDRARLHLLAICSANLEAYIQDITYFHLVASGYKKDLITLDEVGKAIGAPILAKDSLPEPLKYAQKFYGVDYGVHLTAWVRAYKLRCAAVHDGGIVTARTKKDIPDLGLALDEMIGLSWDELKSLLASAEQIATITDKIIARYEIKKVEAASVLAGLKDHHQLPVFKKRDEIWRFLSEKYGVGIRKNDRAEVEKFLSL